MSTSVVVVVALVNEEGICASIWQNHSAILGVRGVFYLRRIMERRTTCRRDEIGAIHRTVTISQVFTMGTLPHSTGQLSINIVVMITREQRRNCRTMISEIFVQP